MVLETIRIEEFVDRSAIYWTGRKPCDRRIIARAFVIKTVMGYSTTKQLREALECQQNLRIICGYSSRRSVPSEATFSRAFAAFASANIGDKVHVALVEKFVGDQIVEHVSRDSTAISAREKAITTAKPEPKPKLAPGRPAKGETRPAAKPSTLEKQLTQSAVEAIDTLPKSCNTGCKQDFKGNRNFWVGWKMHIDWGTGGLPLTAITTSASLHDSQVAIPLARLTAARCKSKYDLMDAAYDAEVIRCFSKGLGHIPIIDCNPRRGEVVKMDESLLVIYNQRSTAERGNARLKDEFGFRTLRVRGIKKTHLHLMMGILVLFSDQLHKLMVC